VYLSKKDIEQKTIAKDQVNGKRAATLTWTLVGLEATQILPGTTTADDLDANLEKLMENTERVLRSYADLGGYTNWQFPTGVSYHSARIDDVNHMRVAFMDLQCKVYY